MVFPQAPAGAAGRGLAPPFSEENHKLAAQCALRATRLPPAPCMQNVPLIHWHSMFMGVALLAAARSKDGRKRNGACIASADNKILGVGYNGLAEVHLQSGEYDKALPFARQALEHEPDEWVPAYNLGMIEDRLTQAFGSIWEDLFALNGEARSESMDKVLSKYLEPLAVRLEAILNG